jgi:transcription antitermination factor NusG
MCPENGGSLPEALEIPWFAVQVRCRSEFAIGSILQEKDYKTLVPFYRCRKPRGTRMELRELPLFPGYVFCQFDPLKRLPILTTPGVIHITGSGKTPTPVASSEIHSLQRLTEAAVAMQPCDYLQVGNRVRVEEGPLKGVEGILLGKKAERRLIISVTLLRRSVAVEFSADNVCSLEPYGLQRMVDVLWAADDCLL